MCTRGQKKHAVDFVVHTWNSCSRFVHIVVLLSLPWHCHRPDSNLPISIHIVISTAAATTTNATTHSIHLSDIMLEVHRFGSAFYSFSVYFPSTFCIRSNRIITLSVFICLFICSRLLCSVCKFQYRFRNFRQIIMPFAAVQRRHLIDVYVQILKRIVFVFHRFIWTCCRCCCTYLGKYRPYQVLKPKTCDRGRTKTNKQTK